MSERDHEKALKRLTAWYTTQPFWRERYEATLHAMLGWACEHAGLDEDAADALWQAIDPEDGEMLTVFATEAFFTQAHGPEGETVIDAYLGEQDWKENAVTRAFLLALRDAPIGFYEVVDVSPEDQWLVRNLLADGDSFAITDPFAAADVEPGTILVGHPRHQQGEWVMSDALLSLPAELADELQESLDAGMIAAADDLDEVAAERGVPLTDATRPRLMAEVRALVAATTFVQILAHEEGLLGSVPPTDSETVGSAG